MTSTSRPTPLLMAQSRRPVVVEAPAAIVDPSEHSKAAVVRPGGRRTVTVLDDGVRKAKHLVTGQRVRPYVHGEARGAERVVATVERFGENLDQVRVSFSTGHPTLTLKPAYRFVDLDAVGTEIVVRKSVFVEVAR